MTKVSIPVHLADGSEAIWTVTASEEPPWVVTLRSDDDGTWSAEGDDLFDALQRVRRETDTMGVKLCVNGARRNAYPSGMARDMGGGQMVYIFHRGKGLNWLWRRPRRGDLAYIFDPAPCDLIATVDEQDRYYAEWVGLSK
jgi:hypothetical protein